MWDSAVISQVENPEEYSREAITLEMTNFFEQNNISYYDLTPDLRKASLEKDVFFRIDGHLNTYGHEVVADALLPYID